MYSIQPAVHVSARFVSYISFTAVIYRKCSLYAVRQEGMQLAACSIYLPRIQCPS